jgi:hypothetical protein
MSYRELRMMAKTPDGEPNDYFKSKKALKALADAEPDMVLCYSLDSFGTPINCTLDNLPNGNYTFCGPNPYHDRRYYGTIEVKSGNVKIS